MRRNGSASRRRTTEQRQGHLERADQSQSGRCTGSPAVAACAGGGEARVSFREAIALVGPCLARTSLASPAPWLQRSRAMPAASRCWRCCTCRDDDTDAVAALSAPPSLPSASDLPVASLSAAGFCNDGEGEKAALEGARHLHTCRYRAISSSTLLVASVERGGLRTSEMNKR